MKEIIVWTPMGILKAYCNEDSENPGIHIELGNQPVSTVEYSKEKGLRTLAWRRGQEDFDTEVIWLDAKELSSATIADIENVVEGMNDGGGYEYEVKPTPEQMKKIVELVHEYSHSDYNEFIEGCIGTILELDMEGEN
jgi:hypothetical protein